MNNSVKFKDYSLKFKDNCCNWRRWGRGVRLMLLVEA